MRVEFKGKNLILIPERGVTHYPGQVLEVWCTRFNGQPLNKVVHLMHKVRTTKNNENICSSNGGAQEKGMIR